MILADVSLRRPVLAVVISLLMLVFGLVSFQRLEVREMPETEKPVISISTSYSGTSAAVMESQVTKVLEDQLSGLSGLSSIQSSSRYGRSSINVEFDADRDLDSAANDVREAVSRATRKLPDDADPPVVSKSGNNDDVIMWITLAGSTLDPVALSRYATEVLEKRLLLIDGVSSVNMSGYRSLVMNIRLDPAAMAARGVTVADINSALRKENVEQPAGELRTADLQMSARITRSFNSAEDFSRIVVRSTDGEPVYLGDVATLEEGARDNDSLYRANGENVVGLGIVRQSQSNTVDVTHRVKTELDNLRQNLPQGVSISIGYESAQFIESAIDEVYNTLAITAGLVVLTIYLFLGSPRATLIPTITVPVSLVAAFISALVFGFSINLITLMALVLAIGLVVDDAIVVLENVHRHLEMGRSPLAAAWHGTREVGFAVVATTAVLVAVFVPVLFLTGTVGRIFAEFAMLLSAAVVFSSVIALTLTPVMCARLLRSEMPQNRLTRAFGNLVTTAAALYRRSLQVTQRRPLWAPLVLVALLGASYLLYQQIPQALTPKEDRGSIFIMTRAAEGAGPELMQRNMLELERRLQPLLKQGVAENITVRTPGFGGAVNSGMAMITLKPWEERSQKASDLVGFIAKATADLPGMRIVPILPSSLRGSSDNPVQFVLGGPDYEQLKQWMDILLKAARENPGLTDIDIDYRETTPELMLDVDRALANQLGIPVADIASTLQTVLGGSDVTTFAKDGEEYDVYLRGLKQNFRGAEDLAQIYLRAKNGQLVSVSTLINGQEKASASTYYHYNRNKSITLSANLAPGYDLGQALDFLDTQARTLLPAQAIVDYKGESLEYRTNQGNILFAFGMAMVVVYLLLAAQFESFVHPLVVMLTVPLGVAGGLFGLWVTGMSLNIYSQLGMIMLVGLVTKNGILLVEFTNQLRDAGQSFAEAILNAAETRFRPIMMTALTAIIGGIPLIFAFGAGAEGRQAIGIVVVFGMAIALVLTLYIVPAMYALLARRTGSPDDASRRLEQALADDELAELAGEKGRQP
ncbi:efflux RND transporter permease subunit [Plesiomonas shigelloides]|uniref:efflux RND transporter permease subunit n=1 Tax=Plesiomonas shigelloides TaxID=703 RepID=UPI002246C992|nr:efflux RND transporter permease subunit [Plesiomonas shigelloides]MCX2498601.1 efflux RND transporter permease subunit [Plesiomonas shigelloides]